MCTTQTEGVYNKNEEKFEKSSGIFWWFKNYAYLCIAKGKTPRCPTRK